MKSQIFKALSKIWTKESDKMKYIVTSHAYKHQTPTSTRKPLIWRNQQQCMLAKWKTLFIFTIQHPYQRLYDMFTTNFHVSISMALCRSFAVALLLLPLLLSLILLLVFSTSIYFASFTFFVRQFCVCRREKNFHRLIYRSSFLSVVSHFLSMLSCWCSSIPFHSHSTSPSHNHSHSTSPSPTHIYMLALVFPSC